MLNFFFTYENDKYETIDDLRTISMKYLKGWFIIDFLAVFPFYLIFKVGNYNKLTRILKLPKLYRLIKMTRLVRMLKIVKERNKLVKYL